MILLEKQTKVYLYNESVDMRKQLDGLLSLVQSKVEKGVQDKSLYLFHNKNNDKVKGIIWDGNGFLLIYKRLEKGRFCLKELKEDLRLSIKQFRWLLSGFDFIKMNKHQKLTYKEYY